MSNNFDPKEKITAAKASSIDTGLAYLTKYQVESEKKNEEALKYLMNFPGWKISRTEAETMLKMFKDDGFPLDFILDKNNERLIEAKISKYSKELPTFTEKAKLWVDTHRKQVKGAFYTTAALALSALALSAVKLGKKVADTSKFQNKANTEFGHNIVEVLGPDYTPIYNNFQIAQNMWDDYKAQSELRDAAILHTYLEMDNRLYNINDAWKTLTWKDSSLEAYKDKPFPVYALDMLKKYGAISEEEYEYFSNVTYDDELTVGLKKLMDKYRGLAAKFNDDWSIFYNFHLSQDGDIVEIGIPDDFKPEDDDPNMGGR